VRSPHRQRTRGTIVGREVQVRRLAPVLAAVAILSACDQQASPAPSTTASDQLLQGSLLQFRRDAEAGVVQVRLTAAGDGLVVQSVTVDGGGFTPPPNWQGTTTLPEDRPLDLRLTLTSPDCGVQPTDVTASVTVAGRPDPVVVPLDDGGLLRRLHASECTDEALREQVRIEVVSLAGTEVAGRPALRATIRLTRLGGGDAVRITGVGPNTVYTATPAGDLPTLDDSGSADLLLDLVPSRCDAHALGESYRTSLLDLRVAVGDAEPRVFVFAPAEPVRRRIERFAVDTCRETG
jgi:hypothetical protein